MNVCVIPARGGSKRIPRKNVREFRGKPLIAWSIAAALESDLFARVIVSTDDPQIAEVAREYGAQTPFVRPAKLSDDFATTAAVMSHALNWLNESAERCQRICCLYATAPFVRAEDLAAGLELLEASGGPAVMTVTRFEFPIYRGMLVNEAGALEMIWPEHRSTRSQDLPEAYHDAGQFYWVDAQAFGEERQLYMAGVRPLVLERHRVQDIDTEEDFRRAEVLHRLLEEMQ